MKSKKNKCLFFLIIILIEIIFFISGLIQTKEDSYFNTVFIFFINVYVIYIGLVYLIDNKNKW